MITKESVYKQIEERCKNNNLGSTFNYMNNPSIFNDEFMDSIIKMFKRYSLQNNITTIYLSNNSLTRFSLEDFPNLTEIDLTSNQIQSITIPSGSKIKRISITNNPLSEQCKKNLQEIIDTGNVKIFFDGMKAKKSVVNNKAEPVLNNEKNSVTEETKSLSIVYTDEKHTDINVDNILDAYTKCNNLSQKLKNSKDNIEQSELEFLDFLANSGVIEKLCEILINKFTKYADDLLSRTEELEIIIKQIKVVELHDSFIFSTNEKSVEYRGLKLVLDGCLRKSSSYKDEDIKIPLINKFRCSEVSEKLKNIKNNSCAKESNLQPKHDKDAFYKGFLLRQRVKSTDSQSESNFHKNAEVKQVVNANNGAIKPKANSPAILSDNKVAKTIQTNNISVQSPVAINQADSKVSLSTLKHEFKVNESLKAFATSGENNNCAFHAIFGTWNAEQGSYYYEDAQSNREKVAAAIKNANSSASYKDDIIESIKALIMEELPSVNDEDINASVLVMKGNKYFALTAVMFQYYQFDKENKQKMQEYKGDLIEAINKNSQITQFIQQNHPGNDMYTAFNYARNQLKGETKQQFEALVAKSNLQPLLNKLDEETKKSFDFNQIINDRYVLEDYADIFRNNIMLLPSELALIAKVCDINIELYNKNANQYIFRDKYLSSKEYSETVKILFNGFNHYERLIDYSIGNALSHEQIKSSSSSSSAVSGDNNIKIDVDYQENTKKRQRDFLSSYFSNLSNSQSSQNDSLSVNDLICRCNVSLEADKYYSSFISTMKKCQSNFIAEYKISDNNIISYGDKYFSEDGLKMLLHYYASKSTKNNHEKSPMLIENAFAFKSLVEEIVQNQRNEALIILNLAGHSWEEEGEYCKNYKDFIKLNSCYLAINLLKKDKNLHVTILKFNEPLLINGISELINGALNNLEPKSDTNLIVYQPKTLDANNEIISSINDLNFLAMIYAQMLKLDSISAAIYNANNHINSKKIKLSQGSYELKSFKVDNVTELKKIVEAADPYRLTCISINLMKNMDSFLQEHKLSKDIDKIIAKYILTYDFSGSNKRQKI